MPERIVISDAVSPTWSDWFIVEAAAASKKAREIFDRERETGAVEVLLKLNGIEVSFTAILEKLEAQIGDMIRQAAMEQLFQQVAEIENELAAIQECASELLDKIKVKTNAPPLNGYLGDHPGR